MGTNCLRKRLKSEIKNEIKDEIKNELKNDKKNEAYTGHKPIPIKIANKVMKSICKITVELNEGIKHGTGFFLNYSDSLKCLLTNYHVINPSVEKENIEIEIHNKKIMKLKFGNRFTKYLENQKDIAMIEIKESDEIYDDIEFLDYDYNCIRKKYSIYKDVDVFSIEHPYGNDASCASGTIIDIYEYEFDHNISTDNGSSGCPIILLNNNMNLIQVIGIHKNGSKELKINGGTFIGEIFDKELNKESKQESKQELDKENNIQIEENFNNYIISEINIKEEDLNKDIRIINSYEEYKRSDDNDNKKNNKKEFNDEYKNEDEIKKCQIKINDELIPFNYFHKFKSKGKYIIKYSFKNNIKKTCSMFLKCSSLINIDLSNFNTSNTTEMWGMFSGCSSLNKINFSNFNTDKVTDMGSMFEGCSSLSNLDLSTFNTKNVTKMSSMFCNCFSLINVDLSSFNTNNVKEMWGMFAKCSSLIHIDLSNFNTNNVTNMGAMFCECSSLTNLDLSNFNTNNVFNMQFMFARCSSLTYLNLSNFNTDKVDGLRILWMIGECSSLKKENLITKDERILSNFN